MNRKLNSKKKFGLLTENRDSFKQKLNHDLEELGPALKGFVTKSSTDHKQ